MAGKKTKEQKDTDRILAGAQAEAQKYIGAFDLTGKYDLKAIEAELCKRTHNGKPVHAVVVASPAEVKEAVLRGGKELGCTEEYLNGLRIENCVWDYYLMAFYGAAYSQVEDQESHEFGKQPFLKAFELGLGYYINLGNLAIGVARPEAYMDVAHRLHRETGPALVWGDTIKQYWWHGVQVEESWIMDKENVDPAQAITWQNVEQRRALCEIIGWEKVLEKLKAKKVQEDTFGQLLEVDLPDAPASRFIRVVCGTGRKFCLPVPSNMESAHEAVAWTYNMTKEEYSPEVRT